MKDHAPPAPAAAGGRGEAAIASAGAILLDIAPEPDIRALRLRLVDALGEGFAGAGAEAAGALSPGGKAAFVVASDAAPRNLKVAGEVVSAEGRCGFRGLAFDITPELSGLERLRLRQAELKHRAGNLYSILAGLVSLQSRKAESAGALADDLRTRMSALANAHRRTIEEGAEGGSSLEALVGAVAAPFGDASGRIVVSGAPAPLTEAAHEAFGVALFEWLTNSVKYGALAREDGRLDIAWSVDGGTFRPRWTETAPAAEAAAGARKGEGSGAGLGITGRVLARLGIVATRDWRREGLEIRIEAPAESVIAGDFVNRG